MRSIDDLERWKGYGFNLTPVAKDKSPGLKPKQKWKHDWSDEVLLYADRIGFFHKESNVFTVDFDDLTFEAHKYITLFPETFRDGKSEDNYTGSTHLTYKVNGQGALNFKYPQTVAGKDGGLLIETIYSKQTLFHANDQSRFVINDVAPRDVDINLLKKYCSLTCFMVEVSRNFPPPNVGGRHEAHLRLTGALARLNEDEYPTELLDDFHQKFCEIIGDTKELKDRMRIADQRAALKTDKKVWGITELREHLGHKLEAYNLLFEQEEELQEDFQLSDPKEYPLIDGGMDELIEYPPVEYLMGPIINSRSFNQTYGWYESGKTVFGMSLGMHMCSGHDFLGWTCDKKIPIAYLESELPGETIRGIRNTVKLGMLDRNLTFDHSNYFPLNQDNLIEAGFKYGFSAIAVAKAHGKDAAKDYGRRGREMIEDWLHKIEKKTGKKPYYFLDNMTKLSTIDENKAQDWNPFLNWGTDLKHKGFSGMFVHHANKGNEKKGSSGSSTIGRLLDTSIQLTKLDPEYRFDIPGQKSLQSSIEFDKSRGFGGSEWSKKRIITMNEGGEWKHYPYLKQVSFKILQLANSGLTQSEIREMGKNKEIAEEGKPPLSSSSVDRLYLELVKLGLIKKQIRQTHCWSCRKKIETNKDPDCTKCQFGIKCGSCGSCWCEKPKEEKHEDNDY